MTADAPDPERARRLFAEHLEDAGVPTRQFIDVRNGEKGTRTPDHQQPENWLAPDDHCLEVTGDAGNVIPKVDVYTVYGDV